MLTVEGWGGAPASQSYEALKRENEVLRMQIAALLGKKTITQEPKPIQGWCQDVTFG